jgi:predicted RNA-binding Zn ribbon-like protein
MQKQAIPFQFVGGSLALDFVNTVGDRLDHERDYFRGPDDVRVWASAAGLPVRERRGGASGDRRAFRRVVDTRERLYRLLLAASRNRSPSKAELAWLNRTWRTCARRRALVASKDGVVWAWTAGVSLPDMVICAVIRDAVDLLAPENRPAVAQCAGPRCGWLFLDRSPGGRRKWCSMADCGNRAKARRHYQRTHRQTRADR